MINPCHNLTGKDINGKWEILDKIDLKAGDSTGGFFSVQYFVKSKADGKRAFLKVLDVVSAIQRYQGRGDTVLDVLKRVANAHSFEAALMEICNQKKLTKIVRALDSGELALDLPPLGPVGFPYLIFELGDGDTHRILKTSSALGLSWWFETLHQAAVGMAQLHRTEIAHQDLKPSNVVFFGVSNAKITDLGRAVRKGVTSINDERVGDGTYIPPEYVYSYHPPTWSERYLALDLYLLGSFAYMYFTGLPMTYALLTRLQPSFAPANFHGDLEEALPALQHGYALVLNELRDQLPDYLRDETVSLISYLCNPDPRLRGHPTNRREKLTGRYSIERFISGFKHLSRLAIINSR